MSDPVSNSDIEDVLSSIRRLVSEEPAARKSPDPEDAARVERLVLTPAFRVPDASDDTAEDMESSDTAESSEGNENNDFLVLHASDAVPEAPTAPPLDEAPMVEAEESVAPVLLMPNGHTEEISNTAQAQEPAKTPHEGDANKSIDQFLAAHSGNDEQVSEGTTRQVPEEFEADSEWRESNGESAVQRGQADTPPTPLISSDIPLMQRVAELEAAIERAPQDWEPDGSEDGSDDQTRPLSADLAETEPDEFVEPDVSQGADEALDPSSNAIEQQSASWEADRLQDSSEADETTSADMGVGDALDDMTLDAAPKDHVAEENQPTESRVQDTDHGIEDAEIVDEPSSEGFFDRAFSVETTDDADAPADDPNNDESAHIDEDSEQSERGSLSALEASESVSSFEPSVTEVADTSSDPASSDEVDQQEDEATANAHEEPMSAVHRDMAGPIPDPKSLAAFMDKAQNWETGAEELSHEQDDGGDDAELGTQEDENVLAVEDAVTIDEEALRQLVGELVREELQGVLGERITRNVRRLVRHEIQRAFALRDLD